MPRHAHELDPPIAPEPEAVLASRLGDDQRHLIEIVRFGIETEAFVKAHPVGQYLVNRAESDLSASVRELLDMSSLADTKAADTFNKAKAAINLLRYIDEAITAGQEAGRAIEGEDDATREADM
jgi:hypothetical protein